jgi:hypothetical protein
MVMLMRARYKDSPTMVPAAEWDHADEGGTAIRLVGEQMPFQQGMLYEFAYQAKDPVVSGGDSQQFATLRRSCALRRRTTTALQIR